MFQNNNIFSVISSLKNASNPTEALTQLCGNNPQFKQILPLISGKNNTQLETMARNMAKERGIDIEALAKQLGLK